MNHIVVIYEENHSFDNLYGGWEGVNGLANAKVKQVNQSGAPFNCLMHQDVNLTVPPLTATCTDTTSTLSTITSHFTNQSFTIDSFIPPTATTCPKPGVFAANGVLNGQGVAGGCTRDIVHRFYQEQYQLDNGKMDRYVAGSDATGLTMGVYDTKALPIYKYLHGAGHPKYAIENNFFQGAFGGSYLNHQWLVCACAPIWVGAPNDGGANDLHSVVDGNGMPNNYPLYNSPLGGNVRDLNLTASCNPPAGRPAAPAQFAVRRLLGQHHPADLPAVPARNRVDEAAPTARDADHRRPSHGGQGRLGLVLRRLVERRRRGRGPRLDERQRADVLGSVRALDGGVPELRGRRLPVPPPAVQLLRRSRAGNARTQGAPA